MAIVRGKTMVHGPPDDRDPAARGRALRFGHLDLAEQVEAFAERWPAARADRRGWQFVADGGLARLRVPLAAVRARPDEPIGAYAARLSPDLGRQVVLLLQAGKAAVGYWDGEELLRHKAFARYVVRGKGRAQPLHRRTRGKSRYGSRLRLQNWRRLLVETSERLGDWWAEFGVPERVFVAAGVRPLGDLLGCEPAPPFAGDPGVLERIPMHVHAPDFAELRRVRGWLLHGRLELPQ